MSQLLLPPGRDRDVEITRLVDRAQDAYKRYKHEHTVASVKALVNIALEMQAWGFTLLIIPEHKCIGAVDRRYHA